MAQWLSWLERRPVTAKVVGSSPIWVVYGVLAQLGEHLPYKQAVAGSSPAIPTICTDFSVLFFIVKFFFLLFKLIISLNIKVIYFTCFNN